MKIIARLTLALIIMLLAALPAVASDLSGATYSGILRVTNSSDAASSVVAAFPLNAQNLIDSGYMASDFSNIAITYGGADMAFMPGYGEDPWLTYVPSIAQNGILDYKLYAGGATPMGGKMAYFPGDAGLTTNDKAALELGGNFEIEIAGWFGKGAILDKIGAIMVAASTDKISGGIVNGGQLYVGGPSTGSSTYSLYDSSNIRAGNKFSTASTMVITSARVGLSKVGSPTGIAYLNLYNVSDGSLIGTLGQIDVSTLTSSAVITNFDGGEELFVTAGTEIYGVVEYTGGDASNYINTHRPLPSSGSYKHVTYTVAGGWSISSVNNDMVQLYYRRLHAVTSAPMTSGYHTVNMSADGTNLQLYIDGNLEDTVAWSGAVTDSAEAYTLFANGSLPAMESFKLTINGTLQQHLVYQYAATPVTDISGQNNQPSSVSVRTSSSDADVSASLISFTPINESIASDIGVGGTSSYPISTTPTQPDNMYEDPDGTGDIKLPGAALINDLLDASGTPYAFFWLPVIGAIIIFASYYSYKLAPTMLVKAATNWVLFIFFAAVGVFGFWTFVLFFICSWTMIVHSRSYGL